MKFPNTDKHNHNRIFPSAGQIKHQKNDGESGKFHNDPTGTGLNHRTETGCTVFTIRSCFIEKKKNNKNCRHKLKNQQTLIKNKQNR